MYIITTESKTSTHIHCYSQYSLSSLKMSLLSPEMILILSGAIAFSLSVGFVFGLLVWHFCGPAAATPRIAQATGSATNLQVAPRRNMRTQEQTDLFRLLLLLLLFFYFLFFLFFKLEDLGIISKMRRILSLSQ